jgi:hypothetical protein
VANYEVAQGPAISAFLSTHGGQQKGFIKGIDTSSYEAVSGTYAQDAILALTLAEDKLAKLGALDQTAANVSDAWAAPWTMIDALAAYGDATLRGNGPLQYNWNPDSQSYTTSPTDYQLSPEDLASFTAGHRVPALVELLTRLNPEFGSSALGKRVAGLTSVPPQAEQGAWHTRGGLYQLHDGEMVLPQGIASAVRSGTSIGSGGSNMTLTIAPGAIVVNGATDSAAVSQAIMDKIEKSVRTGKLGHVIVKRVQ